MWGALGALLATILALTVWLSLDTDPTPEEPTEMTGGLPLQYMKEMVHQSIEAARVPLAVEKVDESAIQAKLVKMETWTKGERMTLNAKLMRNESVTSALVKRGVPVKSVYPVTQAMSSVFNFKYSRPGDGWMADVTEEGKLDSFQYFQSAEDVWQATRQSDGSYIAEKVEVPVITRTRVATGLVETNLWDALTSVQLSNRVSKRFLGIFSPSMGGVFDSKPGDRFSLVFEEVFLNGQKLRDGRVLAAAYQTPEQLYGAYLMEDDQGELKYYNDRGQSMDYNFIKKPVPSARFTSPFGPRFHPILKRNRPHNGVDLAAPTGTPIIAASSGKITHAGWKGANGKLVAIDHLNGLVSYYAHMSYIPRSLKKGKKVKKGQMIGHVGTTGRSTGPHLHFGVKRNGSWIDPMKIQPKRNKPLRGRSKEEFLIERVGPWTNLLRIENNIITLPPGMEVALNPELLEKTDGEKAQ